MKKSIFSKKVKRILVIVLPIIFIGVVLIEGFVSPYFETMPEISIEADAAVKEKMIAINLSRKLGFRQIMEILEAAFGVDFQRTETGHYVCKNNL